MFGVLETTTFQVYYKPVVPSTVTYQQVRRW